MTFDNICGNDEVDTHTVQAVVRGSLVDLCGSSFEDSTSVSLRESSQTIVTLKLHLELRALAYEESYDRCLCKTLEGGSIKSGNSVRESITRLYILIVIA